MKLNNLDNWKGFKNDGLLYFCQRVNEMLFHYSDHIYKVPLLNTQLLIREYLNTRKLVKNGIINKEHLNYIMSEFLEALENDVVVKAFQDKIYIKEIVNRINTSSDDEKERLMRYLLGIFRDYNDWCKEYLKEIVPQEREKKKIEQATRSYISGLIGNGYSHEYIYHYNKYVFNECNVESMSSLETFINRFDFSERQYTVYVAILKAAERYYEVLDKRLDVKAANPKKSTGLMYDKEKFNVVQLTVDALDQNTAANTALKVLNIFFKFYDLLTDNNKPWFADICKVEDSEGNNSFVKLEQNRFNYSTHNVMGDFTEEIVSGLLFSEASTLDSVSSAVRMHNLAISGNNISNGFLNLWSVLEILFVSDNAESKIKEIQKKVIPILERDYINSLIYNIEEYLRENLTETQLETINDNICNINEELWLHKLIILKENEEKREKLNKVLDEYPLLRSRISICNNIFSKKENLKKEIERYSQRINWHLRRLYRTRNALIHSGASISNIKELGEHLHSYVDACILEIVIRLSKENFKSIDDVVINIQLKNELIKKVISKKGSLELGEIEYIYNL